MKKTDDWFATNNPDEIDSPALIFFESGMKENISLLKSIINDPLRLQLVGPKLPRFVSLIKEFPITHFSCLVDNIDIANEISKAALNAGLVTRIYIDLNVAMNRTGITAPKKTIQLYEFCTAQEGIKPVGLHFYDGHARDKDINNRKLIADDTRSRERPVKNSLQKSGYDNIKITEGGSPTFPIYAATDDIECSPGVQQGQTMSKWKIIARDQRITCKYFKNRSGLINQEQIVNAELN